MRIIGAASLLAVCGMLAGSPALADWVPPFKGNDTGGIIAYEMARTTDARLLAVEHGGYVSFACRWVPYGANDRPLRTKY